MSHRAMVDAKPPTVTLPERLELEYMLSQRRLAWELENGTGTIDEPKLRMRLRHIAYAVADAKVRELSALFGKPLSPPSKATIERWVNAEAEATLAYAQEFHESSRQDADDRREPLIEQMRKALRGQRESRASSAILSLNTELIEEVARGGGSSHYRWITQKDDRVRDWHAVLDETIQSWDKEPSGGGSHKGDRGHPGSGYGCRCFPVPIAGVVVSKLPVRSEEAAVVERLKKRPATKLAPRKQARGTGLVGDEGYDEFNGRVSKEDSLRQVAEKIRTMPEEHSATWGPDGKLIYREIGDKGSVGYRKPEHMYEILMDRVSDTHIHNHPPPKFGPANRMFSTNDVVHNVMANMRDARTITVHKTGAAMRVVDWKRFDRLSDALEPLGTKYKKTFYKKLGDATKRIERRVDKAIREHLDSTLGGPEFLRDETAIRKVFVNEYEKAGFEEFNKLGQEYGFKVDWWSL